ncbi:hypothetical protein EVAR_100767_1 [Eumeta japonica]|uniref:Uncharacterized protein n=1 Tax=Eumeta variegata TaxID=151549 RepID=A0A4C1SKQ9_EUMVA|nr:hypothetical protein EVAR_100767_1 [Eumeta japonica]
MTDCSSRSFYQIRSHCDGEKARSRNEKMKAGSSHLLILTKETSAPKPIVDSSDKSLKILPVERQQHLCTIRLIPPADPQNGDKCNYNNSGYFRQVIEDPSL